MDTAQFARGFSIGRAIKSTLSVLWQNLLIVALVSLFVRGAWLMVVRAPANAGVSDLPVWITSIIGSIATAIESALFLSFLAVLTVRSLEGQRGSTQDVFAGARFLIPVLIASLLYGLPEMTLSFLADQVEHFIDLSHSPGLGVVYGIGLLVTIVPITMLLTAWCLYAPAIVFEGQGVVASLRRSAALTKGHRWRIFGLIVLILIVSGVTFYALSAATGLSIVELLQPTELTILNAIVFSASTMISAFDCVVLIVIYHQICAERGEIFARSVAEVFE